MDNREIGKSETAAAFGAHTSITMPDQGMYLVVGRETSPDDMILESGGSLVLRLSNIRSLGLLSFETYMRFMQSRRISFIGPVSVDQQRFTRFLSLFDASPTPSENPSSGGE